MTIEKQYIFHFHENVLSVTTPENKQEVNKYPPHHPSGTGSLK